MLIMKRCDDDELFDSKFERDILERSFESVCVFVSSTLNLFFVYFDGLLGQYDSALITI